MSFIRDFKNSKIVVIIGNLLPLGLLALIFMEIQWVSITVSIIVCAYYICMIIINNDGTFIFPIKSKVIYTPYGKYFLVKYTNNSDMLSYCLYENRYWLFLSDLKQMSSISFDGNYDTLTKTINEALEIYMREGNITKLELMNKWDGITDEAIRREKTINKVL
jgi:hypothetical protein